MRTRGISFSLGVLIVLLTLAGVSPAHAVRVKVVMTQSNGPNDVFPDVATTTDFDVTVGGVVFDFTDDNVLVQDGVPAGPQEVTVDAGQLGSAYRVGSVVFTPSLIGVSTLCNPTAPNGGVTVDLDPAVANPEGSVDFVVAIRIVAKDSEPLAGGVTCGGPVGCSAGVGVGIHPLCHGGKPTITGFVVPSVMQEGKLAPVDVSFSDPGGAVNSALLEENLGGLVDIWRSLGQTPFPAVPDGGTVTIGLVCSTGIPTGSLPGFNRRNFIRATVTDVENISSDPSAEVKFTCVAKAFVTKFVGAIAETLAVGAIVTAAVAAGTSIVPHPAVQGGSKLLALLATALKFYKGVAEAYNSDPPDSNFTVIAEPAPPALVLLAAGEAPTPQLADAANALAGSYAEAVGAAGALLHSYERAQGAGEGLDSEWYTTQMGAAGRFAAAWAAALQRHGAVAADLQAAWQATGLPEVTLTAAQIQALQADFAANGPSDAFRALLLGAGADQDTIDALVDAIVGADANAIAATSFPAALTSPAMAAGIQEAVEGFGHFAEAFPACQCDDANPCTDDACTDGVCRNTPRPGTDGVACVLRTLAPPCDAPLPKALSAGLDKARRLVDGVVADPAKARKLLGKAQRALGKASKAAAKAKRKGKLPADCADAFVASVEELRARLKELRA